MDGPAPKIMANLMERHIAGGKSVEDAKAWVKRIDLPNARIAESSKMQADVVIERDHEENLTAVVWRGEEKEMSRGVERRGESAERGGVRGTGMSHGQAQTDTDVDLQIKKETSEGIRSLRGWPWIFSFAVTLKRELHAD